MALSQDFVSDVLIGHEGQKAFVSKLDAQGRETYVL